MVFAVEDRGLGIDADDRKHIFEPFYRGRDAVSQQIQGSGLGLNLVQRIAEAHGGQVGVTSEPGKGSTFTLSLPAVHDRPAADIESRDPLSDKRLLLVEDEPGLQLALSDRLSAEGYAVETAGDGNTAVDARHRRAVRRHRARRDAAGPRRLRRRARRFASRASRRRS